MKLLIVKNILITDLIAGHVHMVTCLFPCKGEENTEILNTYLNVLERDIFKVSMIGRSKNPEPSQCINLKNKDNMNNVYTKYFVLSYLTAIAEQE